MKHSELSFKDILEDVLYSISPVKIYYNDKEIYNDYDNAVEIEFDIYGEMAAPEVVIPERNPELLDQKIFGLRVEIVDFHHSIVWLEGEK